MKRIFLFLAVIMAVLTFALPCFAEEPQSVTMEVASVDTEAATVMEGEENATTQDWLTELFGIGLEFLDEYEDRIMAGVLLVVAIIYKVGSATVKKKILPKIEQQGANAIEMISAAGKLTKTNKENFDAVISEVKGVLAEDNEREKRLISALETERMTTEAYREICKNYENMIREFSSASLSQGAMVYEALMSAKLTDVRKEEIERQYLGNKAVYENILYEIKEGSGDEDVEENRS